MEALELHNPDEIVEVSDVMETDDLNDENEDISDVKVETVVNLNDCCVSCLTEGNNEHIKLRVDKNLLAIYKEFVNKRVSEIQYCIIWLGVTNSIFNFTGRI